MEKLGDLYTDFSRIDMDMRGGYARVAQITPHGQDGCVEHRAFKLMRHEIDYQKGFERFENELRVLVTIANDSNAPAPIPHIYDSGFVMAKLSEDLHNNERPEPNLEIISTGIDIDHFRRVSAERNPQEWLPYLVVDLAPYDDNLLRQIRNQPKDNPSSLFRLPTGEVIFMAIQLLDTMKYLHEKHGQIYLDWKPEHIFWNGINRKVRLIDWNVTASLKDDPGEKQNIRDDLRLFCVAVLYIPLAFVDPDDPTKPIGPRPTKNITAAIPEIRQRYLTENPDFYQRDTMLDSKIKQIIKMGLDPKEGYNSIEELVTILRDYAVQELGLHENDFMLSPDTSSPYLKAIIEMRSAQKQLLQAQQHLIDAVKTSGKKVEFTRLFDEIKRALMNLPGS